MTRRLDVKVNTESVSMARAISAVAGTTRLLVLTGRALGELAAELGSMDAALRHLLEVAEARNKPIGINLETGLDTSSTAFVAPRAWSEERLTGWIAGHHAELEREFGAAVWAGTDDGAGGGTG